MNRLPVLLLAAGSLLACTGAGTSEEDLRACDGSVQEETLSLTSDKNGSVTVPISVGADDAAIMVLTAGSRGLLSTDSVLDPAGEVVVDWSDWADSRESLTNAFYATDEVSALNWPVREEDGALSAGDWTVLSSTLDDQGYPRARQDVDVTVLRRACLGSSPTLPVAIAYAGGLADDREVRLAVEAAAARWSELYSTVGVAIEVSYLSVDIDGSLPEPLTGGPDYAALYAQVGEGVVVVIGDDVAGHDGLYGEAGGIPGPLLPSSHSVVAVSWLVHAGGNGTFDDDEIEVFAETMAHEVGHFLGLFHPVESSWSGWDALGDTKRCTSEGACESALGTNLMFPYPVCGRECLAQSELTDGQVSVLLNNAGVR
jgi:hypothetical protein